MNESFYVVLVALFIWLFILTCVYLPWSHGNAGRPGKAAEAGPQGDPFTKQTLVVISTDDVEIEAISGQQVFFDTRNSSLTATLPDGVDGDVIELRLLFKSGLPAYVNTTQGTIWLTPAEHTKRFVFTDTDGWRAVTEFEVDSFFVTTQQGDKLIGTGASGGAGQGSGVALSADGNTMAIGGSSDNTFVGAVWIFTRTGIVWTQQGTKLVGTGNVGASAQGLRVALSADGNTLAVGGSTDDASAGAVWIWTRTAGVWTQQGLKLVGTGAVGAANQGISVALSADGNTLAVGGYADDTSAGAAWIWTRTAGVWTQQGLKLVGSGATGAAGQGISVALSADGNTLAVGGLLDDTNVGATWVWTRFAGVWTQQGAKLVGSGDVGTPAQGNSVSLSADGNTLAVSGPGDNGIGAVWVWTRSNETWTQQGAKLVGTGGIAAGQGTDIYLSSDGNTLAVGGSFDNGDIGAVWIWCRSGGIWFQQGAKLVGSDASGTPGQGSAVALSADGNTLACGGPADATSIGAVWVFI